MKIRVNLWFPDHPNKSPTISQLRRKWSFRLNGKKQILVKRPEEREEHVLMKVFMARLYLKAYPNLKIEVRFGGERKYKPDVLSVDAFRRAVFWGECGSVSLDKLRYLLKHYPQTHFALAKWDTPMEPYRAIIEEALDEFRRNARVDLIHFPDDARYKVKSNGEVVISWEDVDLIQWEPG